MLRTSAGSASGARPRCDHSRRWCARGRSHRRILPLPQGDAARRADRRHASRWPGAGRTLAALIRSRPCGPPATLLTALRGRDGRTGVCICDARNRTRISASSGQRADGPGCDWWLGRPGLTVGPPPPWRRAEAAGSQPLRRHGPHFSATGSPPAAPAAQPPQARSRRHWEPGRHGLKPPGSPGSAAAAVRADRLGCPWARARPGIPGLSRPHRRQPRRPDGPARALGDTRS